jgi:hypothetical protein
MTGAVTATPAAPAAGNATLLSAGSPPAADPTPPATPESTPPAEPPKEPEPEPGPETEPAKEEEGEADAKPEGAPEAYSFEAPPGVTLDPAAVEVFAPVAKEMNLTQAQAQRFVEVYADLQQRAAEAQAEQVQQWAVQVRNDPEIGGRHMVDMVETANVALKRFGTPELSEALKATGLCNHPEMVRAWAKVGKAISDDGHVIGGQPGPEPRSAESFYAKMPKLEGAR